MYDPKALFEGAKFNVKNCEFVVIYNGQEMVMTREEVIRTDPKALIEWFERKLVLRPIKK